MLASRLNGRGRVVNSFGDLVQDDCGIGFAARVTDTNESVSDRILLHNPQPRPPLYLVHGVGQLTC